MHLKTAHSGSATATFAAKLAGNNRRKVQPGECGRASGRRAIASPDRMSLSNEQPKRQPVILCRQDRKERALAPIRKLKALARPRSGLLAHAAALLRIP